MSFGKLLATGKSLVGGKYDSRYRTNNRAILPKFISPKNPFASAPNKDGAPTQTAAPATPVQGQSSKAVEPVTCAVPSQTLSGVARTPVWRRVGQVALEWAKKLNPLSWFFRAPQAGKSRIPRFGHKPVQAEFPLEKVRVVRNDLRDADLEVLPVGASGNKTLQPGTAWNQLATRIFGPGPTH